MQKLTMVCDLCGVEYDYKDDTKPDGRGDFINLRTKYPLCMKLIKRFNDDESFDLCLDCSIKITRFVRQIQFENGNLKGE